AEEELSKQRLELSVLHPLLQEQLRRVIELGPQRAQTGPAARGDISTLKQHLELMSNEPTLKSLYLMLSRLINPDLPPLE
ncbi:MAG: DUF2520 domain-containing protein, partial [Bacteroidota bacterium]